MSSEQDKIPFAPPLITEEMIEEVVATLRSGWITTGPRVAQFEADLAGYCQVSDVLCVNSATAGLELMLRWFGVGPGDEVIVPAYTYCATANVVVRCGAKPIMADVGSDYLIDVERLPELLTARTKAIIPVDVAGLPCDYQAIRAWLNSSEVGEVFRANGEIQTQLGRPLLLADAAHSLGGEEQNEPVGCLADVTVFSFHAVKNLTTAEGGAIALNLPEGFNNQRIYQTLRVLILHGQTKDARSKMEVGGWKYDVIAAGFKMNMTDIQAALGLVGLRHYKDNLVQRAALWNRYDSFFKQYDWALMPQMKSGERVSGLHLYLLRINGLTEDQRDAVIQRMAEEGIATNVHFQPLPRLSVYAQMGYHEQDYPVSMQLFKQTISLPLYPQLSPSNQDRICRMLAKAVSEIIAK